MKCIKIIVLLCLTWSHLVYSKEIFDISNVMFTTRYITININNWISEIIGEININENANKINYVKDLGLNIGNGTNLKANIFLQKNIGFEISYDNINYYGNEKKIDNKIFNILKKGEMGQCIGEINILCLKYFIGNDIVKLTFGGNVSKGGVKFKSKKCNKLYWTNGSIERNIVPIIFIIGISVDYPLIKHKINIYADIENNSLCGGYTNIRIGEKIIVLRNLKCDIGYRYLEWKRDILSEKITEQFPNVIKSLVPDTLSTPFGGINFKGLYYGLEYFF